MALALVPLSTVIFTLI